MREPHFSGLCTRHAGSDRVIIVRGLKEAPRQRMSRYSLNPIKEGSKVDVGYDPLLDSYFLQVRVLNTHGEVHLKLWRGNGLGGFESGGVVSIPEKILEEAASYAAVPSDLLEALLSDRNREPELVESEPVVYAGMPNNEVWRHRPSVDPHDGVLITIRPSRVFERGRQLAMVLLRDFLGDEARARRLAKDFAAMVVRGLPENRPWLLTDRDLQEGVCAVETRLGLNWIAEAKCYAGEGQRVTPEAQLHRSGRIKKRPTTSATTCHALRAKV